MKTKQKVKLPCPARLTRSQKKTTADVEDQLQGLSIEGESEESEAECPKCGLVYGEDTSMWIQCDACNVWYNLECTNVNKDKIPDFFNCESCC